MVLTKLCDYISSILSCTGSILPKTINTIINRRYHRFRNYDSLNPDKNELILWQVDPIYLALLLYQIGIKTLGIWLKLLTPKLRFAASLIQSRRELR